MREQTAQNDKVLDELLNSIEAGHTVALVTMVKATGRFAAALGQRLLVWLDREPAGQLDLGPLQSRLIDDVHHRLQARRSDVLVYESDGDVAQLFVEVQRSPPTLLIVGAGHVALPLAQLGKMIDFKVVVLDDRPRYANRARFPMADEVLARPFRETLQAWPIDSDTYIVLVTRGHTHDVDCLLEVLDSPARYIGMIGSKRRVKGVFDLLEREQAIDPDKLDRVYAPIGLDIGAETPVEIGVAVIAEIINLYRGGRAVPLSDALRADRRLPLHPGRTQK